MAEVQRTTESGETTELFLQFLMMQEQQALLALGKHPKAPAGAAPKNLALGKIFIDHLGMLRDKTRGNLSADEQECLERALLSLKSAYLEAVKG